MIPNLQYRTVAEALQPRKVLTGDGGAVDLYPGPYVAVSLRTTLAGGGTTGGLEFLQESGRWFEIAAQMFDRVTDFGDLTSLELRSFLLGQHQEYLLGGGAVRFDSISGTRDQAISLFRPFQYSPPLVMQPGNRLGWTIQNNDPAEMQIGGYLEGRQLVRRSDPFIQTLLRKSLKYGQPFLAPQTVNIPGNESAEYRIEATGSYGFSVTAIKIFDSTSDQNLGLDDIRITSIRTVADHEHIYSENARQAAIPARLFGGVVSDLGLAAASPADTWHYLPFPLLVPPNHRLRIVFDNQTADPAEIRVISKGQFLLP